MRVPVRARQEGLARILEQGAAGREVRKWNSRKPDGSIVEQKNGNGFLASSPPLEGVKGQSGVVG